MNVNPNQETELVGHLSFLSVKYWMKHLQIVISFSLGQLESHWNSLDNQTKNRPGCSNKKVELKWITCPKTKYLWTIRDEKCFLLDMQMIIRCFKKKKKILTLSIMILMEVNNNEDNTWLELIILLHFLTFNPPTPRT